ncbi:MAG: hypothetical protein J6K95_06240 [Rikenellaceae bacterium]|nr:hypothetical protein [Rikenellaceae bacterium]
MAKTLVIDAIREKVLKLIAENRKLNADYGKVCAQRDRLRAENRELQEQIAKLERRVSVLELSGGLAGGSMDRKRAKARVNRLMREIDRCIALINS